MLKKIVLVMILEMFQVTKSEFSSNFSRYRDKKKENKNKNIHQLKGENIKGRCLIGA